MKEFSYIIKDELAMHIGPAGRLAQLVKYYPDNTVTINMGERSADASKPLKVALMGIRKGDKVTVVCEGPDEVDVVDVIYNFFVDNM